MEVEEGGGATGSLTTAPSDVVALPQSLSVIRKLASCDNRARSNALRELRNWLPTQLSISDDEMKKLWKGLFYCIWHSDKAPVQANLIDKLSSLLLTLGLPLSLHYFSDFLTTLRREWSGIDVLRLDKFYLLVRQFVNRSFQLLKKNGWDLELSQRVMGIYEEKSLLAEEKKFLGNGVNYHIVSVFLEELKSYLPVSGEICEVMFKPFFRVMSNCQDKVLVGKIRNNIFEFLLNMGKSLLQKKKNGEDDVEDDEVVNFGTIALTMGFAAKFYELGSSMDCFQGNRKVLFALHQEFLKLEKDMEVSGIKISPPMVVIDYDDNEVPELIPLVPDVTQKISSVLLLGSSEVAEEGHKRSLKKKKKKKKKEEKKKVARKGLDSQENQLEKENEGGNVVFDSGASISSGVNSDGNGITFSELFKSNLQLEFEKIADEAGLDKDGDTSLHDLAKNTRTKKRKRMRSVDAHESNNAYLSEDGSTAVKSGEKSAKKVRFAIKNNLVWKPQSPLPPQSVRIPPSVTPRGSALKKGVPPGPVIEMPRATKRVKKKKVRKVMKTTSPAIRRLRKLQKLSVEC